MPDASLYSRLTTYAGLAELVGLRVYPLMAPESPLYPACVYLRVSDVPHTTLDWKIQFRDARYQVSCYAETRPEVSAVAEQVIAALHGYIGGAIKKSRFDNYVELPPEPGASPSGGFLYHIAVDFTVSF